jgi:hypothetical protein
MYYGGDFGYWCVFVVRKQEPVKEKAAEPVKPRRRMLDRR